jgi:LysR family transcriptional activator of mexEF-oprN operon
MLDDLHSTDLNLMVVFATLMHERSVTLCAARLAVRQSTISGSLARLRTLFDDPLFIRAGRGVRPTQKAMELARSIGPALELLHAALTHDCPSLSTESPTESPTQAIPNP